MNRVDSCDCYDADIRQVLKIICALNDRLHTYEAFVLMCLLSEVPLATYADVWEMSFSCPTSKEK